MYVVLGSVTFGWCTGKKLIRIINITQAYNIDYNVKKLQFQNVNPNL
jgi:hypothetical protein